MTVYDFNTQLRKGHEGERELDAIFRDRFIIRPALREEDRRGIDRHFYRRTDGRHWTIQYKADDLAARTGNAFIETISVFMSPDNINNKAGWAHTTEADFILYYTVGLGPVYIVRPADLRKALPRWAARYRKAYARNKTYSTVGLLVPLRELETLAVHIEAG